MFKFAGLRVLAISSGCFFSAALLATSAAPQSGVTARITYEASTITQTLVASTPAPTPDSYFGMHIHHLVDPSVASKKDLTPFPSFAFSTMRLWDTVSWRNIEATRNSYDWDRMDQTVKKAEQNGVSDFIFTFGYVPQWASSNPNDTSCPYLGSCDPPANLADLDSFANRLVQRYCGVVKYYETWNEPSGSAFWKGTNTEFLALTQHIYKAVKDPANCGCTKGKCGPGDGANPNEVLLPPIDATTSPSSRKWLEDWLSYVGSPYPYADIAAFHGYGYTTNPEDIGIGVNYMKSTLSRYGLGSAELWDTEASWGNGTSATQDQQASWLIRFQVMQELSGVSRFTWYAYDNCDWGTLWGSNLCTNQNLLPGVHESGTAYSTVQSWLSGATLQSCEGFADGTWLCNLSRSRGYAAWIAWNSKGNSTVVSTSSMQGVTQYRDWKNEKHAITGSVQVGSMPILIENENVF